MLRFSLFGLICFMSYNALIKCFFYGKSEWVIYFWNQHNWKKCTLLGSSHHNYNINGMEEHHSSFFQLIHSKNIDDQSEST